MLLRAGEVTFAGSVAGRLSVTVAHGGGLRTSYSYLSEVLTAEAPCRTAGDPVGRSGAGHHGATVHWSVRIARSIRRSHPLAGMSISRWWRPSAPDPASGRLTCRAVQRGILGGTFDPPHIAHLIAGEVAYRELGLDVVTFMPAGAPWQKAGRGLSEAEHRWKMTSLAVEWYRLFRGRRSRGAT